MPPDNFTTENETILLIGGKSFFAEQGRVSTEIL
jgi:hypothetical protein